MIQKSYIYTYNNDIVTLCSVYVNTEQKVTDLFTLLFKHVVSASFPEGMRGDDVDDVAEKPGKLCGFDQLDRFVHSKVCNNISVGLGTRTCTIMLLKKSKACLLDGNDMYRSSNRESLLQSENLTA